MLYIQHVLTALQCGSRPPSLSYLLTYKMDRAAPADVRDAPLLQTSPPLHGAVPAVSLCRRLLLQYGSQ